MTKLPDLATLIAIHPNLLSDWLSLSAQLQSLHPTSLEFNLTRVCWEFGLLFEVPTNDDATRRQLRAEFGLTEAAAKWCLNLAHAVNDRRVATTVPASLSDLDVIALSQCPIDRRLPANPFAETQCDVEVVGCTVRRSYDEEPNQIATLQIQGECKAKQPQTDILIFIMVYNERRQLIAFDNSTKIYANQRSATPINRYLHLPIDQKISKITVLPARDPRWQSTLTAKKRAMTVPMIVSIKLTSPVHTASAARADPSPLR